MKSTKRMVQSTQSVRSEAQNLEVRYGKIGISAVAAAMRYQGDAKNSHSPTVPPSDRWLKALVPEIAA